MLPGIACRRPRKRRSKVSRSDLKRPRGNRAKRSPGRKAKLSRLDLRYPPRSNFLAILVRAHLAVSTIVPSAALPLPARDERGEGWGEECFIAAMEFFGGPSPWPSPHSFVVGRGNPFLAMMVVSRCAVL